MSGGEKRAVSDASEDEGDKRSKAKVEAREVTLFREFLRIETVHPNPDYESAIAFLQTVADDIGLKTSWSEVYYSRGGAANKTLFLPSPSFSRSQARRSLS